jgi:hypothetical protein
MERKTSRALGVWISALNTGIFFSDIWVLRILNACEMFFLIPNLSKYPVLPVPWYSGLKALVWISGGAYHGKCSGCELDRQVIVLEHCFKRNTFGLLLFCTFENQAF